MIRPLQVPMNFNPETEWVPPFELPDLSGHREIAIDLETRDPNIPLDQRRKTQNEKI